MTYHGVVLLSAGFQADEAHILTQYRSICNKSVFVFGTDRNSRLLHLLTTATGWNSDTLMDLFGY